MKLTEKINCARNFKRDSHPKTSIAKPKLTKGKLKVRPRKTKKPSKELLEVEQLEEVSPLIELSEEFKEVAAVAELFNSSALPLEIYNRDKEIDFISSFLSP